MVKITEFSFCCFSGGSRGSRGPEACWGCWKGSWLFRSANDALGRPGGRTLCRRLSEPRSSKSTSVQNPWDLTGTVLWHIHPHVSRLAILWDPELATSIAKASWDHLAVALGCFWVHPKNVAASMAIHGWPWSMDIHGHPYKSLDIHVDLLLISMDNRGCPWRPNCVFFKLQMPLTISSIPTNRLACYI